MTTPRERLDALLGALADEQIEIVLSFAKALSDGRAVVASCSVAETTDTDTLPGPAGGV